YGLCLECGRGIRISFDIKELQDFLDKQGCDYGWIHVVGSNIRCDWESNINHVKTKYKDIELRGKLIE
ncbi:hypothetical protein LCGC14_1667450, partial [marine sediment metagenome]